jgi:transposase
MINAVSKNKLSEWFKKTAIQHIRPVAIDELTSQRYWQKWERVSEEQLDEIAQNFFTSLWKLETPDSDCLLFDTTNYYTFMASDTQSELAQRGKNKQGRHHLRQIGLGLLVSHKNRLPLFYRPYPGNMHDSRFFQEVMDEMFGIVCGFHNTKERLTVVFDKGMNSEKNIEWIDEHRRVHFITNYSTYFAEELAAIPLERFDVADIHKNRQLCSSTSICDRMLVYRCSGEYWGRERTVVVTYNPRTARKQTYAYESKIEAIRSELLLMRKNVREQVPHWRNAEKVRERYLQLCERLHMSSDFFTIDLDETKNGLTMAFHKNVYAVEKRKLRFGKNIIITDNSDWTTSEIVEANLDRWEIENSFRTSKNDDLVGVNPVRHWTDSKIRCHMFCCVVALTYLRLLELRLQRNGINKSAEVVMTNMHNLNSVIMATDGRSKPYRKLEEPSKTQQEVLMAFGYKINDSGVLQKMDS